MWAHIDKYVGNTTAGFNCANALWPNVGIVFHPSFTAFAARLKARHIPLVDLGGYCPSGGNQFDVGNPGAIELHGPEPYNGLGVQAYVQLCCDCAVTVP